MFKSPIVFLVLAQRWIQRLAHRGNQVNDRAFEALSIIAPSPRYAFTKLLRTYQQTNVIYEKYVPVQIYIELVLHQPEKCVPQCQEHIWSILCTSSVPIILWKGLLLI